MSPVDDPPLHATLLRERETTQARIEAMHTEFDEIVAASAGCNSDDEHDPEGATIAFERAKVSALLAQASQKLEQIEGALERLERGQPPLCTGCGQLIGLERMMAMPVTELCVNCASRGPGAP